MALHRSTVLSTSAAGVLVTSCRAKAFLLNNDLLITRSVLPTKTSVVSQCRLFKNRLFSVGGKLGGRVGEFGEGTFSVPQQVVLKRNLVFRGLQSNRVGVVLGERRFLPTSHQVNCYSNSNCIRRNLSLSAIATMSSGAPNLIEQAKKAAAYAAVDNHVQTNFAVGIGSGSTVVYAAERLAERIAKGELKNIRCIPTSFQSLQLIRKHKLVLTDLEETPQLDVTIDGADEADAQLTCIKGGGGCQTQEKIVAASSKKFVVVADYRKNSARLGEQWHKGVPVEVVPMAYAPAMNKIEAILGKRPVLRQAVNKAGPVVTDNGNFVLDCPFPTDKAIDWKKVSVDIKMIPGVVETGLFVGMAEIAYYGQQDGTVKTAVPQM